jgi:hypothetical protein
MFRERRFVLAAVSFVAAIAASSSYVAAATAQLEPAGSWLNRVEAPHRPVMAAAADYRFELVGQPIQTGAQATVTVRLVRIQTNQPVANAVIYQQRLEMPMQGMAPMSGVVGPAQADGQGNYRFAVQTGMGGDWTLTLAARIQGETEVVRATLRVRSTP